MSETKVNAGQLLMLDEGAYSNYSVIGFFVALQDFDPFEQLRIFAPCPADVAPVNQRFEAKKFLAFLLKQGFLLEISYRTLYLTDNNRVSEVTLD